MGLVVFVASLGVGICLTPTVYEQRYEAIRVGMTGEEVSATMGPDADYTNYFSQRSGIEGDGVWFFKDRDEFRLIIVRFDRARKVRSKTLGTIIAGTARTPFYSTIREAGSPPRKALGPAGTVSSRRGAVWSNPTDWSRDFDVVPDE
jgi:hypothetical protein